MSGTKKTKTAAKPVGASMDAKDDIDQIMNEIEQLQQEIDTGAPAVAQAPTLSVVPQATDVEEQVEVQPEEDALSEFRAAVGEESSLEETLSELKDEGQGGSGLLDEVQALHEQVETESHEAQFDSMTGAQEAADEITSVARNNQEVEHIASFGTPQANYETPKQETFMEKPTGSDSSEGSLTMTLTGNMSLKLRYEFEGQEVTVGFVDNFLQVTLADGTEFKVPVARAKALRRVA